VHRFETPDSRSRSTATPTKTLQNKSNSQLGAAVPKPTVIRWRGERVRDRRFRPFVDTIEVNHQAARSFQSRHRCLVDDSSAQSVRCPNLGGVFQCDSEPGELEPLFASRSRQRESVCEVIRISAIRKTAPDVHSSLGFAVAVERASHLRVADMHEATY
jgi:hypothetical protein